MASSIAHELSETATDPHGDTWRSSGEGNQEVGENADLCVGKYGLTYYTDEDGRQANLRLGDRNYLLQQNWVPIAGGYCGLSYEHEAVSVGTNHTLAAQADGSLWSWGKNDRGQLGDGGGDRFTPSKINAGAAGARWISVGAGNRFSVALRSDHTLWAWGDHSKGSSGTEHNSSRRSRYEQVGGQDWEWCGLATNTW